MDSTHVCGCVGSSPRETFSPWISLKHFSQKWYLLARSPYLGELHRSPRAQPITEKARGRSHQSGQGRPGEAARRVVAGSSQSWSRVFVWADWFDWLRVNFGEGWLVAPKQANADITSVKEGGREKGRGGRGGGRMNNLKKCEKQKCYGWEEKWRMERWRGGTERGGENESTCFKTK